MSANQAPISAPLPASNAGERRRANAYDVEAIRRDFPILRELIHGKPLVYLDNANTTQKPELVIEAEAGFYRHDCSNIHRAVYLLGERATEAYEGARRKAQAFINAAHEYEIIFTRGTTEAINLVASSFSRMTLQPGDEVLITGMEHHSNIVPWQLACESTGAKLRVVPITNEGEIVLEDFERSMNARTKLVSVVHVSNALGTINPVKTIVEMAHNRGIPVLVDGAQSTPHQPIDVQALGCDFFALSSHKMYGPTGIGVLYGRGELLEKMPPYQGGGDMISSVTFEKTLYNDLPYKFEAGTPNIAGTVAFGAAIDYLTTIGMDRVAAHEATLLEHARRLFDGMKGIRIIGAARERGGVFSFMLDGVHPHDVATLLDAEGIAVRAGHHCAQPVMDRFGVPATTRASFGLYNTTAEIDALADGIEKVKEMFR